MERLILGRGFHIGRQAAKTVAKPLSAPEVIQPNPSLLRQTCKSQSLSRPIWPSLAAIAFYGLAALLWALGLPLILMSLMGLLLLSEVGLEVLF